MERLNVGLFNDSFPPVIDGVANAVINYARCIQKNHGNAVVATPWYPKVKDQYPFEVIRYPSAYISQRLGYRAGYPFDPITINRLERRHLNVIHTHSPFISAVLARVLRFQTGAPVIFTYHTKFDIDIEKRVAFSPVRSASVKFILNNVNACDEVWVVSHGAGENLRGLGYLGDYIIMENGTDFARAHAPQEAVQQLRQQYHINPQETVFLFVGRMMWYKGVRLSIDGLRLAAKGGCQFRMFFVGDGADRSDIEDYVKECGLEKRCVFTGAIRDRELLRSYFSMADLFLFPSTYDTNGIVVREAAACYCPSLLIRGSCAAEGITDGVTGVVIEENADSLAKAVADACRNRSAMAEIGRNAAEKIYLSWEEAVARAYQRYEHVLENYQSKLDMPPSNEIFFDNVQRIRDDIALRTDQIRQELSYHTSQIRDELSCETLLIKRHITRGTKRFQHNYRVVRGKLKHKLRDFFETAKEKGEK